MLAGLLSGQAGPGRRAEVEVFHFARGLVFARHPADPTVAVADALPQADTEGGSILAHHGFEKRGKFEFGGLSYSGSDF